MICIFEGPDGAGKSTMIEAVANLHEEAGNSHESISIWHAGPFPEGSNPWSEYVFPLSAVADLPISTGWLLLIDRWHLGELVYGPIFRGKSQLSMRQRTWIEGYLKTMGATMVHLTASQVELERRLAERGDDMVKAEHLPSILASYDRLVSDGHQPRLFCRTYDTTGNLVGPTAAAIYHVAKLDTAIADSASRHPSGDPRPYWERNPWPS